jgi:ABC-type multidrug transport system fused ATPase/permease subunit
MRGRTTIIVSHRMSTVLQADRILVLEDGAVAEFGAPGTLLNRKGPFAAMHRRQQIESELEAL